MWDYEMIGTIASCIVLISFLFNDKKTIRIINCIGSIIFIVYGILIHSFSLILLNSMLIVINVIKLIENK